MSRIDPLSSLDSQAAERLMRRSIPLPVALVILGSLVLKLFLIQLNQGEYTDGIIQLQLWETPVVFFPPGYTFLARWLNRWVGDLLMAGRLVSIFASVASLVVFYGFAQRVLACDREAFWATLFLALSPIFNRWSLRVMTDSLFCFLFIANCALFIDALYNPKRSLAWLVGLTGISTLVRYQGLFFLLCILFLVLRKRFKLNYLYIDETDTFDNNKSSSLFLRLITYLLSLLPWLILGWWIGHRGFGHTAQFVERASNGFWITLLLYFNMFETFILYWPWAGTYGLFLLGVVGCVRWAKGTAREQAFLWFAGITAGIFLLAQSAFLSFQYRYLLPLVPLWCLAGAKGWSFVEGKIRPQRLRAVALGIVIANLLGLTLASWYLQRATFGDLVESAKFLREVGRGLRVLSDESYRAGVYNVKMRFWSGRDILYFSFASPRESLAEPKPGDLLVLHNEYTDIALALEQLKTRFDVVVLKRWSPAVQPGEFVTVPLLPDIMVSPSYLTSNPPCMAFRFTPQPYLSVVLRLGEKKN